MLRATLLMIALASTPTLAAKPPPLDADALPAPSPRSGAPVSSGTGFFVADGRALTNNHVVAGCRRLTARNAAGRRAAARVLGTDRDRDLALLGLPAGGGPALVFRDTPPVQRGESVVTYGFPLTGLLSAGPTLTTGDVSALSGLRDNQMHFTITAPVQPGNSGGPLLDGQAHVIGVIVSKLNAARIAEMTGGDIPQNVNFAIKGATALAFLREQGITPQTAETTTQDRRAAEIGTVVHPSTLFIQCYR